MTPESILACSDSEHAHQVALFVWASQQSDLRLKFMFAIPNGGLRQPATAMKLKAEGVKSGVPDIFLPVARSGYHGLFIELKRPKKSRLTKHQTMFAQFLLEMRYLVRVAYGFEQAKNFILEYLERD